MSNSLIDGMENRLRHYNSLGEQLLDPEVFSNPPLMTKLSKERSDMEHMIEVFNRYKIILSQLDDSRKLLSSETDPEIIELAKAETETLEPEAEKLEEELKIMLLPKDPLDDKGIIMEIRAGTGGEEASLFAGELYRMYTHYAEKKGWKTEILSSSGSEVGGFKEVVFSIAGDEVFSHLKYESGVHRVQRVPVTEASGRIHTSAASVVVMPEAEDINIALEQKDLKIDVYRSTGPGGQSVNTTDSAVRITHIPTGIVVSCQDEKSQLKNKNKAMKVLKARLFDKAYNEQNSSRSQARKSMIGSGDRSEKIRTYNFPQSRVTDHRINMSLYNIEEVLTGDVDKLIESIRIEARKKALEEHAKGVVQDSE